MKSNKTKQPKKDCSCQNERPVKKEPKNKPLEKITMINNIRIV